MPTAIWSTSRRSAVHGARLPLRVGLLHLDAQARPDLLVDVVEGGFEADLGDVARAGQRHRRSRR